MNSKRKAVISIFLLLVLCILALPFFKREYGDTNEFRRFKKQRVQLASVEKEQSDGNYTYALKDGILSFKDKDGNMLWQSDAYWYVDDFSLFDVDGDGQTDCLFSLWKSYSYYKGAPKENNDKSVKNHLFLYTVKGIKAKALWCSSNLPRPVYSFSLEDGKSTSVSSGTVLKTIEGTYRDDLKQQNSHSYTYTWEGWGFVPAFSRFFEKKLGKKL